MSRTMMKSRLALAVAIGGVAFGGAVHAETDIEASVTVQNSLTVQQVDPLDFGTISVPEADESGAEVATVTIRPDGETASVSTDDNVVDINIINAGEPAQASVESAAEFILSFPENSWDDALFDDGDGIFDDTGHTGPDGLPDGAIALTDPDGGGIGSDDAVFFVFNFTLDNDDENVGEQNDNEWTIDPVEGVVELNIGATLATDDTEPDDANYSDDTTYEGSFTVEANY